MQELFVDKIQFFKFLSTSDKPWLNQLKVITATHVVVVQASLNLSVQGTIGTRKEKYQQGRGNTLTKKKHEASATYQAH